MPAASKQVPRKSGTRPEHDDSPGVTELMAAVTHPLKPTIEAIRGVILAADPAITEGVKWNSPSFYCQGWFATIAFRKPTRLDVILHCGAKVQMDCTISAALDDPDRLLTWPSKDRALLSFKSHDDFVRHAGSFRNIVSQWAAYQKRNTGTAG